MRLGIGLAVLLGVSAIARAQSQPVNDPQAVAMAAQSILALTGSTQINDVTLTANAISITGSDGETGTALLKAKGLYKSRVDLVLTGGSRSEIRNIVQGYPEGTWVDKNAVSHRYADQNCWTDPTWFFPALSSLSGGDPNIVLSYLGPTTRFGVAVQHIRSFRTGGPFLESQQLSVMDFYLDATTLLPVSIAFNLHPDNDSTVNVPVETYFGGYQIVGGILVPMHFQLYLQGVIHLDFTIRRASVNSGLQDSVFGIQ